MLSSVVVSLFFLFWLSNFHLCLRFDLCRSCLNVVYALNCSRVVAFCLLCLRSFAGSRRVGVNLFGKCCCRWLAGLAACSRWLSFGYRLVAVSNCLLFNVAYDLYWLAAFGVSSLRSYCWVLALYPFVCSLRYRVWKLLCSWCCLWIVLQLGCSLSFRYWLRCAWLVKLVL